MEWTQHEFETALAEMRAHRGDTTNVEVKRAAGGLPRMAETLCAFANMPNGGTVILGVDEADGRFDVTGIKDVAALEQGLTAMARNSVRPEPHLDFQTFSISEKSVLLAHISPLRTIDKPAYVADRAYLRQSDGDYPMQPHEIRMLEIAKLLSDEQTSYDLAPAMGRSTTDLEPALVNDYLSAIRAHDRRLRDRGDDEILRMTSVLTSSGEPTLAGLYAMGSYPQGHYPSLGVTAAVQLAGGEGHARNRNLCDFTGAIPVLLEDLMDWVEHNLDTIRRYRTDGHMESVPELPMNAVRELIANALVHRDLGPNTIGRGKQIQIRLTAKNLLIQSPGGLRGVSLAQIESVEHAQAAVNQRLYQMAKRLTTRDGASIIEGEGGGIREVFRSAEHRGLPRPHLIDTGVQFTALLWRPSDDAPPQPHTSSTSRIEIGDEIPSSSSPTRNEAVVLSALHQNQQLTIHQLVQHSGLSMGQVRYALVQPLRDGLVIMEGRQGARDTRYRLVNRST